MGNTRIDPIKRLVVLLKFKAAVLQLKASMLLMLESGVSKNI